MKKYKELIIAVVVVLIVVLGVYFLSKTSQNKYFKEITYNEYVELSNKDSNVILYVGSKDDKKSLEEAKKFATSKSLSFRYIYIDELSDKQKENLNYSDSSLVLYKNDEEDKITTEITSAKLQEFFSNLNLIDKTYVTIGIDEYLNVIKKENTVIFVAREGCGYCDMYKPIINEVMNDKNITIYHLDITKFTEEDYKKMYATADYFTEEEWGTPTTLIFNKGKVVNVLGGYVEKAALEDFLKTNGVI